MAKKIDAKFAVTYLDEDTGRSRVIGTANTVEEAFSIRDKKAKKILLDFGMDEEDEISALAEVVGNREKYVEWNGQHFEVKEVK